MRHIRTINEFHDLSRSNNYLIDKGEDTLSLDTESIVGDLMRSLAYYKERLPYYDGADRTLTPQDIQALAEHFSEIQRDNIEELTMGGTDNDIDLNDDDEGVSLEAHRENLIRVWSACDLDDLSDMFVDWVEDAASDGLEDWLES
jgi:hypothetical protein